MGKSLPALAVAGVAQVVEQTGRAPQAMPWAEKASQMRQALGVPLARLPSSSSAGRKTVYQLVAAQPSTLALALQVPPLVT